MSLHIGAVDSLGVEDVNTRPQLDEECNQSFSDRESFQTVGLNRYHVAPWFQLVLHFRALHLRG